jgi:hypothetical protein
VAVSGRHAAVPVSRHVRMFNEGIEGIEGMHG